VPQFCNSAFIKTFSTRRREGEGGGVEGEGEEERGEEEERRFHTERATLNSHESAHSKKQINSR